MDPTVLAQVLRPLESLFPAEQHPELLVGLAISDDAAVYRITADVAVIQTLDFFTPVVDDAYDYGAIAAANALSDVYAMGGEVALALNICAFPPKLPQNIVADILRGGAEKVAESGGALVGGHTIDDEEPKYGLSVMGIVHPDRMLTKAGAQVGDILFLTKPLGVGIITTAFKGDVADPDHFALAVDSMKRLNRRAAQLAQEVGVHACTDISGFSLLGHGYEMAEKSGVQLSLTFEALPFLEGAKQYADDWLFPAGSCKNQNCYGQHVQFQPNISEEIQQLLFTPETSGGLLLAVAPDKAETLSALFADYNQFACRIGEVASGTGITIL